MTLEETRDQVAHDAETVADGMVRALADKVGWAARADAVFGDPVERDDVTVIPVAKVRWGFGGGSGSGSDTSDDGDLTTEYGGGGGGGGGVAASPLGFIELKDGEATFRRVQDPAGMWPLVLAAGVAFWLVAKGLRTLFR